MIAINATAAARTALQRRAISLPYEVQLLIGLKHAIGTKAPQSLVNALAMPINSLARRREYNAAAESIGLTDELHFKIEMARPLRGGLTKEEGARLDSELLLERASSRLSVFAAKVDHWGEILLGDQRPNPYFYEGKRAVGFVDKIDGVIALHFNIESAKEDQNYQDLVILHEYRHYLVATGRASIIKDFSVFGLLFPSQRINNLMRGIKEEYVPRLHTSELDAYIISSVAQAIHAHVIPEELIRNFAVTRPLIKGLMFAGEGDDLSAVTAWIRKSGVADRGTPKLAIEALSGDQVMAFVDALQKLIKGEGALDS